MTMGTIEKEKKTHLSRGREGGTGCDLGGVVNVDDAPGGHAHARDAGRGTTTRRRTTTAAAACNFVVSRTLVAFP